MRGTGQQRSSTAASGPTAGGQEGQRKVGAIPGVWPDKGPSSFLASGQANHTNPVARSTTQSASRNTKKAPEHICGMSWMQEGFQFSWRGQIAEMCLICKRLGCLFPYQEIGDECKSSASPRMLGGDRDRVKFGTRSEFWYSSFKWTSPLWATHSSPCATPSIVFAQDLTQRWRGKHSGELIQPKTSPTGNRKKPVVWFSPLWSYIDMCFLTMERVAHRGEESWN